MHVVRWETELFDDVCKLADAEWMKEVCVARQGKCVYKTDFLN